VTVPAVGTAPLDNPDHTAEHQRIATQLQNDLPRGIIAYTMGTLQGAAVVGAQNLYTLSSVTLLAGRLYLFAFTVRALQYNVQGQFHFYFNPVPPSIPYKHCSLYVDVWKTNVAGAAHDCVYWEHCFTVDSDVTIPVVALQVDATNGNIWTNNCFMLIRDIGPDRGKV
jgi:hypothetical protein